MRFRTCFIAVAALMQSGCDTAQSASTQDANGPESSPAALDDATLFEAAGFQREGDHWAKCGDPGTDAYEAGTIGERGDFNGDSRPDAFVMEGSTACFGMTGLGYTLISQQADGTWAILSEGPGVPRFLETKGADGWPDLEIGGPGFCFPVHRWNGQEYDLHRSEYEGRPCEP